MLACLILLSFERPTTPLKNAAFRFYGFLVCEFFDTLDNMVCYRETLSVYVRTLEDLLLEILIEIKMVSSLW